MHHIEILEPRIAPATLLSPSAFSYMDIDGDKVTVKFTKPILTEANFDSLVSLVGGLPEDGPQQLINLNLAGLDTSHNGLGISIVAKAPKESMGDGRIHDVAIGASNVDLNTGMGMGIDLGVVKIDGDVRYIEAGDPNRSTMALKSFTAGSLGLYFAARSDIYGAVGTFNVLGDVAGWIRVETDGDLSIAKVGTLKIGGSVLGQLTIVSGIISAEGGFDRIIIGGDLVGATANTGSIVTPNAIGSVLIKGSILGGIGANAGYIGAATLGKVTVNGTLFGGSEFETGVIESTNGAIGKITLGSIVGSTGSYSGAVKAALPTSGDLSIGSVIVKRGVSGTLATLGDHAYSGAILAEGSIGKVTVSGGFNNASITAGVHAVDGKLGNADDAVIPGSTGTLGPVVLKGNVSAIFNTGKGIRALNFTSIKVEGPAITPANADFVTGFSIGGLYAKKLS